MNINEEIEIIYEGSSILTHVRENDVEYLVKTVDSNNNDKVDILYNEYQVLKELDDNSSIRKTIKKGVYNGRPAIWLEYVQGSTLYEKFRNSKANLVEFLDIAIKVLESFNELHYRNIIHNDISSQNILLTNKGNIKIIDLELATKIELKTNQDSYKQLKGTLKYISPELTGRINKQIDIRSDIYSLGIVFYKLLSGEYPFSFDDPLEIIYAHIAKKQESLSNHGIPNQLSLIIDKMLEKKPEQRYQTTQGVIYDLKVFKENLKKESDIIFELGRKDYSLELKLPNKIYGREKQLSSLKKNLTRKCLTFISGESGSGKTALVQSLQPYLIEQKGLLLTGKFDKISSSKPFSALADIFESFIQSLYSEKESILDYWKQVLSQELGDTAIVLETIVPGISKFLNINTLDQDYATLDDQNVLAYAFSRFMYCLDQSSSPIVIFIDDFQWADSSSLYLIEYALKTDVIINTTIIGAYRNNEWKSNLSFNLFLETLDRESFEKEIIEVGSLNQQDICKLLSDCLRKSEGEVNELGSLIYNKTGGNAFFVNQFIEMLYTNKYLNISVTDGNWSWDINNINKVELSSNVIDLIITQFSDLSENSRLLLGTAACLGRRFNSDICCKVLKWTKEEFTQELITCIQKKYLITLNELTLTQSNSKYIEDISFSHDKIIECAVDLLDEKIKRKIHYEIFSLYMNQIQSENDMTFKIANHLNNSISDDDEIIIDNTNLKLQFEINTKAGISAKNSAAYDLALKYLSIASEIADDISNQLDDDIIFNTRLNLADAIHFTGDHNQAEQKYLELKNSVNNKYQRALVSEKLINFYTNNGNFQQAYQIASIILHQFGIKLPKSVSKPRLIFKVLKTRLKLRGKQVSDIINLPEAQIKNDIISLKLLGTVLKSAYQIAPELCVECSTIMVSLCLNKGNTVDSPVGYFVFGGIFLGGVLGDHKLGYEFGDLSLKLVKKYNSTHQESEIKFIHGYFTNSWVNGQNSSTYLYQGAFESGIKSGDFFHMSCSRTAHIQANFMSGIPLNDIYNHSEDAIDFISNTNNLEAKYNAISVKQSIKALQGQTNEVGEFDDDLYSELVFSKEENNFKALHFIHCYHLNKLIINVHLKQFDKAIESYRKAEQIKSASQGMQHSIWHELYTGLLFIELYKKDKKASSLTKINKSLSKLKKAKKFNSKYYSPLYELINTQLLFIKNENNKELGELYKNNIQSLKARSELQLLALAQEYYSDYLRLNGDREHAHLLATESQQTYSTWGAYALVNEKVFDNSNTSNSETNVNHTRTIKSSTYAIANIDVKSIMKASTSISEEIQPALLFEKLIYVIVENAGATKGYLLLNINNKLIPQCSYIDDKIHVFKKEDSLNEDKKYPESIISYATRTLKTVIINNDVDKENYKQDPYFQNNESTYSILCKPLIRGGELQGVIYLENSYSDNMYTPERVDFLSVMSAQIAISINNAMLYDNLEYQVLERTNKVIEQKEIIEQKNRHITDSIKYTKRIQTALMPPESDLHTIFPDSFILNKPRDIVSGDFYYFKQLSNGDKIAIVADCTGHGVPGAVLSSLGAFALNSIINYGNIIQPNEILNHLHQQIRETFDRYSDDIRDGMDISVIKIENSTKILMAGAMNSVLTITPQKETNILVADKLPIGHSIKKYQNKGYTLNEYKAEKGTMIYLFSDGFQDQFGGPRNKKFMRKNFYKLLTEISSQKCKDQSLILDSKFKAWKGNQKQLDDVLIMGVRL